MYIKKNLIIFETTYVKKMKKYIITTMIILLGFIGLKAQDSLVECKSLVADSTEFAELNSIILNNNSSNKDITCNKIRVVVHVIYNGHPNALPSHNGQITPEQVKSQIRITNQFFRNDSLMYNPNNTPLGYEVELATTDPNGNPTTGIIYHDGYALFGEAWHTYGLRNSSPLAVSVSTVASALAWGTDIDGKRYINSYVVPKIDGNSGGGVQAFAYFPTTSVVFGNYNLYNAFGAEQLEDEYGQDFNLKTYTDLGYTWTHELLHNFSLFHTFQGQSCVENNCALQGDRVCDTPPQTQGNGCFSVCGFLSENVMDYLSQVCKNRITQGQVDRAARAIEASLPHFLVCPPEPPCETTADINKDGFVNLLDLSLLNIAFGSKVGDPNYNINADLNCDGVINLFDVSIFTSSMNSNVIITESNYIQDKNIKIYDINNRRVKGQLSPGFYIFEKDGIRTKQFITR